LKTFPQMKEFWDECRYHANNSWYLLSC
jgi:hypothetical protein